MLVSSLLFLSHTPQKPERFEIEKLARELGMGYKEEFILYEEVNEGSNRGNDETNIKSEENSDFIKDRNPDKISEEQKELQKVPENKDITIPQGSTTEEIAHILEQAGIISDANVFQRLIDERNLSRKIRAGDYTFNKDVDAEEIISIITKD